MIFFEKIIRSSKNDNIICIGLLLIYIDFYLFVFQLKWFFHNEQRRINWRILAWKRSIRCSDLNSIVISNKSADCSLMRNIWNRHIMTKVIFLKFRSLFSYFMTVNGVFICSWDSIVCRDKSVLNQFDLHMINDICSIWIIHMHFHFYSLSFKANVTYIIHLLRSKLA